MRNKVLNFIKSLFLSGLFTILPIVLTIYLFNFSFRLLAHWFEPLKQVTPDFLKAIPYAEFLVVIAFIFVVGIISKFILLKSIIHWLEALVLRIPLVRPVYNGIKQLVHALTQADTVGIQEVVFTEFPRKGTYTIGFITGQLPDDISPDTNGPYFTVFIPTTPTPTTGYLITAKKDELIPSNLTRQEAMALVISGGIIHPDKYNNTLKF